MPKIMSARVLFWWGIALIAAALVVSMVGINVAFALGGNALANNVIYRTVSSVSALVFPPLGVACVVVSLVINALSARNVVVVTASAVRSSLPPKLTARTLFWVGIACIVLGLVVSMNLASWNQALWSGSGSLLRDFVSMVINPLYQILIPLGALLVPVSMVIRMLEAEFDKTSGAGVFGAPPPPHNTRL